MRIALAQINPTVGDISGNCRLIRSWTSKASRQKADLVIFPELCVTGYPPRDLVEQAFFVDRNRKAVHELASQTDDTAIIIGFVDRNTHPGGKPLYNAAALLYGNKIQAVRAKTLLPTYDVFDEARHFEPARENQPVAFKDKKIGLTICEDMWNQASLWPQAPYNRNPVRDLAAAGADFFVNLSSSPFHAGKTRVRLGIAEGQVHNVRRPFFFCNQVGANDELIFDGNSFAVDSNARLLAQAKSFREDLLVFDLDAEGSAIYREHDPVEDIHDAIVLGLRDYARKCGFQKVLLGLSGGIDSAVTCALAVEALGKGNVLGVSMPSSYSSSGSVTDSRKLARNLGIRLISLPISPVFSAYGKTLKTAFGRRPPDVTEENLQARIRGTLLMAVSNKFGMLLLTTGNKSEISTGYCTLYGDMNGGLAVISDVPKMKVYALGRFINRRKELIPEACFTKPPSAELRPNQTDQDSLPPYDVLDAIVEAYIEEGKDVEEIAARGYPEPLVSRVLRMIDRNEYKRRQAPPGLRITPKAFGIGRRMPIARGDFRT
jgi:NAD+ synthetase